MGDGVDAYGTPAFGTPTSPFGYSGQYVDATTGLVNDRARWFQPQTGGFTARDPDFATTDTAYTYANGDPVNQSDPSGGLSCDPSVKHCEPGGPGFPSLGQIACAVAPLACAVGGEAESVAIRGLEAEALGDISWIRQSSSASEDQSPECGGNPILVSDQVPVPQPIGGLADGYADPLQMLEEGGSDLRLPDYISIEASIPGLAGGIFNTGVVFTYTRYGAMYLSSPTLGITPTPGFEGSVEAGWIDQFTVPSASQLNSFVSGSTSEFSGFVPVFGAIGPAAAEVWGQPGSGGWSSFSTQIGIGAGEGHNVGLTWSYSYRLPFSGPSY